MYPQISAVRNCSKTVSILWNIKIKTVLLLSASVPSLSLSLSISDLCPSSPSFSHPGWQMVGNLRGAVCQINFLFKESNIFFTLMARKVKKVLELVRLFLKVYISISIFNFMTDKLTDRGDRLWWTVDFLLLKGTFDTIYKPTLWCKIMTKNLPLGLKNILTFHIFRNIWSC